MSSGGGGKRLFADGGAQTPWTLVETGQSAAVAILTLVRERRPGLERRFRHAGAMDDGAAEFDFDQAVEQALDGLPGELRQAMSNVEIVVEDEPPDGAPLLGLYQGVPLTRRGSAYGGVPPDKITIYRGPLERFYGTDPERLRQQIAHVVVHEIAHHFGISDERLIELGRY